MKYIYLITVLKYTFWVSALYLSIIFLRKLMTLTLFYFDFDFNFNAIFEIQLTYITIFLVNSLV